MTIKVTNGFIACKVNGRRRAFKPADGPIDLPDDLEALFVRKGAAEYVGVSTRQVDTPTAPVIPGAVDDAAPTVSDEAKSSDGYDDLTLKQLKGLCIKRGIVMGAKANRAKLIGLLRADDKPPAFDTLGAE